MQWEGDGGMHRENALWRWRQAGYAPASQECREPADAGRGRGVSPQSLWRERGLDVTVAPDHQPPELTDKTFPLFQFTQFMVLGYSCPRKQCFQCECVWVLSAGIFPGLVQGTHHWLEWKIPTKPFHEAIPQSITERTLKSTQTSLGCLCVCSIVSGFLRPMDSSPPGSSVHGILKARILEWVAISHSRGSSTTQESNPSLLHWQADSLPLSHLGSPRLSLWKEKPGWNWLSQNSNFP